jgi:hypothetical protein
MDSFLSRSMRQATFRLRIRLARFRLGLRHAMGSQEGRSSMIEYRNKELPLAVHHALATLGRQIENGNVPHALPNALDRLSELPARAAFNHGQAIADAAGLRWRRSPSDDVTRYAPLSDLKLLDSHPDIAWLFLFHRNGYVREAALDSIDRSPTSPFFYAAIACRLNDWVAPVRHAAVQCAARVLPHAGADLTAHVALDMLERRVSWTRWGDEENSELDALFGEPVVVTRIASLIREGTTGPMAKSLTCALRYPSIDRHLSALATSAVQPAVRAVALRCLLNCRASWPIGFRIQLIDKYRGERRRVVERAHREVSAPPLNELIVAGLSDRSAMIRLVATDAFIAQRPDAPALDHVIERLGADKSPALRGRADFMRRRLLAPT